MPPHFTGCCHVAASCFYLCWKCMRKMPEHTAAFVLMERWSDFLSKRDLCLHQDHVDNIHDLRVATRRLRAALLLFEPYCTDSDLSLVYPAIKSVTREVGALRNIDECIIFIQNNCLDPDDVPDLFVGLIGSLNLLRKKESDKVYGTLKHLYVSSVQHKFKHITKYLNESAPFFQGENSELNWIEYLSDYNMKLFKVIHHLLPLSVAPDAVLQRHALRISIKQWRYFLEILSELTHKDYGNILHRLRDYQVLLGHLNDLSVFTGIINKIGLSSTERNRFELIYQKLSEEYFRCYLSVVDRQPIKYEFLI